MFNDGIGGYNEDVLSAEPTTEESKLKLVEELKSRAKGCIGSRNFPEAIKLYSKAIEVTTGDDSACAILHANRSMCYLNMGNASSALDDGRTAEKLDSSYVKTYYRQAMACKALDEYKDAISALQKGLALKPDDKEMRAQLAKLESDMKNQAQKSKAAAAPPSTTATNSSSKPTIPSVTSGSFKPPQPPKTTTSAVEDDEDDDADLKALNLRGYKKTSDGRTTTFFNNELDEEAKRLIGDIAPKKLDASGASTAAAPAVATSSNANLGTSAWNSAGTYEERILTPWVTETLTASLGALHCVISAATDIPNAAAFGSPAVQSIELKIVGVENMTGDAQVTMARGKKKYICDYCADLKWQLLINRLGEKQAEIVEGKLALLDITADKEYEIGTVELTQYRGKACTSFSMLPGPTGQLVKTYIKESSARNCLDSLIKTTIEQFCDEFKTK